LKNFRAYVTELAVPKITSKDIAALKKIFRKAKGDLEKDEVKSFIETGTELHKLLMDNCGNECLRKMINENNDNMFFIELLT